MIIPDNLYRSIVSQFPDVVKHLTPDARALVKAGTSGDYDSIRGTYWAEVYDAVENYLDSAVNVTAPRNKLLVAMGEAFTATVYIGYQDGGGELPLDDDTAAWMGGRIAAERGFITDLFARLKEQRGELDPVNEALARANGYASGLDQVYSEAKLHGSKNKMYSFVGDDGEESCPTCQKMKGQRHRGSWWIKNDLIPGSTKYECGGYNCQHVLVDDSGQQITL